MSIEALIPYIVVLIVGLFTGVVNTLAGGGSLITLPLLIFMGLTPGEANGTNRIAIWVQCVTAVWSFRQKGISNFKECIILSIPTIIGAVIGAQFSAELPDEVFKIIIAVVMLFVTVLIFFPMKPKQTENISSINNYWLAGLVFLGIGFYGGFIQVGVGFLLIAGFNFVCRFNLVDTAAARMFIVAAYTSFAVLVFIVNGLIDWQFAITLSIGNGIGAIIGSSMAVKRGENFIRWILVVVVTVMSLKLLGIIPEF